MTAQMSQSLGESHTGADCPQGTQRTRNGFRMKGPHVGALGGSGGHTVRQEMANGGTDPRLQGVADSAGDGGGRDHVVGGMFREECPEQKLRTEEEWKEGGRLQGCRLPSAGGGGGGSKQSKVSRWQ